MSKVFEASCDASGKVTADGVIVTAAVVLSDGKAASTGLLFVEGGKCWYVPSSATDIGATIQNMIDAIDQIAPALTTIATTFTAVAAGMTGPTTAPPPTLPTNVSDIVSKVTGLNAVKLELETLKGALK